MLIDEHTVGEFSRFLREVLSFNYVYTFVLDTVRTTDLII
jgi:hypothetical protein